MKLLSLAVLFDAIVLSLRTGISPYQLDIHGACVFENGSQSDAATALTVILIVSKALIIVAAAYLSYAVRNLPQLYNESSYLAVAIYNCLLISAVWLGIRFGIGLSSQPDIATLLDNGVMMLCTFVTLSLVFLPSEAQQPHRSRLHVKPRVCHLFASISMLLMRCCCVCVFFSL